MSEENRRRGNYITTIVARDGRFKDLVGLLKSRTERSDILDFEEFPFYLKADYSREIRLRDAPPEFAVTFFDVYCSTTSATNTHAFDQGIGWFLSCLIKTGYTVSASKDDPEKLDKAKVDF